MLREGDAVPAVALIDQTGRRFSFAAARGSTTIVSVTLTVPVFAITLLWLGTKERFAKHRRIARWAFPIWMYVSVTGERQ